MEKARAATDLANMRAAKAAAVAEYLDDDSATWT
jgi:flagellar motility protein MotE (MotC chaperone)